MFVVMQWVDFGSSSLEVLIPWQTKEPEKEKEQTLIRNGFS